MIHRIGRTGRNGLSGHAITLIREEEMNRIEELEKMGVHFDFVEIKNGELVPRKHYRSRENRQSKNRKLDTKLVGYVKKRRESVSQVTRRRLSVRFKRIIVKNVSWNSVMRFVRQNV